MHFDLSADQMDLRDGAAALLARAASPERVRRVVDGDVGWDADLWTSLVDQGWLALEVAEAEGGLGLGAVEVAVVAEQVGRHVAPAPVIEAVLAVDALRSTDWYERVASGDALAAVSTAPGLNANGGTLAGRATLPVSAAPLAEVAVVVAEAGGSPRLFVVDLTDVRPTRQPAMDRTRALGWLELDGVEATELGGPAAVERFLDRAATFASAELLGIAERMMEESVAYAKERQQFDRPIGSFQAVKHRCADMLVDVEGMRSAAWWAAWCVDVDDAERSMAASTAKIWCSDAGRRVTESALQVFGGIGFTWEHDVHLYLKRAQLTALQHGDAACHRRRLAGLLRQRLERGDPGV